MVSGHLWSSTRSCSWCSRPVSCASHDADAIGEPWVLWADLIEWKGDPHFSPFHIASYALIGVGMWLLVKAWRVLYQAQSDEQLAMTGPYARVRHPQYSAFGLIMIGFLLQWPTIPTIFMFPVLLVVYRRLALREERAVGARFGPAWDTYMHNTPRFIPHLRGTKLVGPDRSS